VGLEILEHESAVAAERPDAQLVERLAAVIALEAVATAIGLTTAFGIAVRRARRCQAELDVLKALDRDTIVAH